MLRLARGAAIALVLALAACATTDKDRTQAGTIQDGRCVLNPTPNTLLSLARCCAESLASNPSCREYNRERGYVIVKDNARDKPEAYLIIPVAVVTGIEDPQVLRRPVADFWHYGWGEAGRWLRIPDRVTALAINSVAGRSQNQLHIHISCARADVLAALERARRLGRDPARPLQIRLPPAQHLYRAVVVRELVGRDEPFEIVTRMPGAEHTMAQQSIAVLGSRVPQNYYVLDTTAGPNNPGSAEELLDQTCSATPRE